MSNNISKYQKRYLAHQKRKKDSLAGKYTKETTYSNNEKEVVKKVFKNRRSSRVFSGDSVELEEILELVDTSPSSCDRKGVCYKIIDDRQDKEILSGLLVGGVGWINRADKIVLLLADMEAYGSPYEKEFMPYLDSGVLVQSFYLACEVYGIKCCYVNPNIREKNKQFFKQRFSEHLFCGAIIIGK